MGTAGALLALPLLATVSAIAGIATAGIAIAGTAIAGTACGRQLPG